MEPDLQISDGWSCPTYSRNRNNTGLLEKCVILPCLGDGRRSRMPLKGGKMNTRMDREKKKGL